MQLYGYARVSTTDQDLWLQQAALKAAGCTVIRSEKVSGTSRNGRTELDTLLDFIRKGDTLVVTRVDRLARSIADLQDIVRTLKQKGAALKATEQPIDTSTAAGKAFLDMLGVFAEFETNLRRERQLEGIAKAKAAGVYKGRKPSIEVSAIKELKDQGLGATEIAKRLGIGRSIAFSVEPKNADRPAKPTLTARGMALILERDGKAGSAGSAGGVRGPTSEGRNGGPSGGRLAQANLEVAPSGQAPSRLSVGYRPPHFTCSASRTILWLFTAPALVSFARADLRTLSSRRPHAQPFAWCRRASAS
jgi:DNA invertase Pin-like site-specific DNA recombinase